MECHGNDTPLIFHDTHLFYLLILLVHLSKFNVHDIFIEIGLISVGQVPSVRAFISITLSSAGITRQAAMYP